MLDSKERPFLENSDDKISLSSENNITHWTQWKDIMWTIAFVLHILFLLILALYYGIIALDASEPKTAIVQPSGTTIISTHKTDSVMLMGGVFLTLLMAAILSISWVIVMSRLASRIIFTSFLIVVILSLMVGLSLCASGYIIVGVLFILISLLGLVFFVSIRKYVDFAAAVLSISCDAVLSLPETIVCSSLLLVMQLIWALLWVMAVIGVATNEATSRLKFFNVQYKMDQCTTYSYTSDFILSPSTTLRCAGGVCNACICQNNVVVKNSVCFTERINTTLFVFFLFSLIWTCTVTSNVVHCTTAASVSNWWFRDHPSKGIVKKSLQRSVTTLFGSICLGSLLVALVRTCRILVSLAFSRLSRRSEENSLSRYIRCVLDVCLQGLDWLTSYFNKYAFCYVAMYGHSFWDSSRAVLELFNRRGWLCVLNDELIDTVLSLSHFTVGCITTLLAFAYSRIAGLSVVDAVVLDVSAFFIGYLACCVTMKVISAAVCTVFVCYAESPEVFLSTHPESYRVLAVAWRRMYPVAADDASSRYTADGTPVSSGMKAAGMARPVVAPSSGVTDEEEYMALETEEGEGGGGGEEGSSAPASSAPGGPSSLLFADGDEASV